MFIEGIAEIESQIAEDTSNDFCIDYRNWNIWQLYLSLGTQWQYYEGMVDKPIRMGFDYAAVIAAINLMWSKQSKRRDAFEMIRCLETGFLQADRGYSLEVLLDGR